MLWDQKGKNMYADGEERCKTVFIHRWHDWICRKIISKKKERKKTFVIIDYSKLVRLKANIWKSINTLHNCNDYVAFEIVNYTAYITIHKMKYLGKNLTKYKIYMRKLIWKNSKKNQING